MYKPSERKKITKLMKATIINKQKKLGIKLTINNLLMLITFLKTNFIQL
jgi:hypothetical protein